MEGCGFCFLFAAKKLHSMQGNFKLVTLNCLCCMHKTLQSVSIFFFFCTDVSNISEQVDGGERRTVIGLDPPS